MLKFASCKNIFIGRLEYGVDLCNEINKICTENNITLGRVTGIGAVQKAKLGYYNQTKHIYQSITLDQPLEILSLMGNISLKEGKPFVHLHAVLGDENSKSYGGHILEGTIVYASEIIIDILEGPVLERSIDNTTMLSLW